MTPILIYTISYVLFFGLLLLSSKHHGNRLLDEKGVVSNRSVLLLLYITGIILMGVVSFCSFSQSLPEIIFGKTPANNLQVSITGFFVIAAFIIAPIEAKKKFILFNGSKPGNSPADRIFIVNYFFVRIIFLCAYEIWFRGYLLTTCIGNMGIPLAITLNIILYGLLHIVNGRREIIACVPLGLLFCGLCIWTGSAWPAILIHVTMAVSYEAHLIKRINKSSISFV